MGYCICILVEIAAASSCSSDEDVMEAKRYDQLGGAIGLSLKDFVLFLFGLASWVGVCLHFSFQCGIYGHLFLRSFLC